MYLQTAKSVEEVVEFGVKPAIELMNIAEDLTGDRVEILRVEVKAKLLGIREALNRIDHEMRGRVTG